MTATRNQAVERKTARRERRSSGRLLKSIEAEAYTGIPKTTLRDAAIRGELPYVPMGRCWYYERADLDRFIDSKKQTVGQ